MSDQTTGGAPAKPNNRLVMSIIAIFFCWPFAVAAIVNATKVDKLYQEGDHAGANEAAAKAKKWATIAFIIGGLVYLGYFIFIAVAVSSGGM